MTQLSESRVFLESNGRSTFGAHTAMSLLRAMNWRMGLSIVNEFSTGTRFGWT
jgi:hypothetical protein